MSTQGVTFGYYPKSLDIAVGPLSLQTAPGLEETAAMIEADDGVEGDWIYAPLQQVRHLGGGITERPYAARIFGLPKTHTLTHTAVDNNDHLVFHLWALSFFSGMRLTSTEAGFIDCTPIKPGKLVDFVLLGGGVSGGIALAEAFWSAHRSAPHHARLFAAAVHALFLAQNPRHLQFESFLLLYTAFDACFALAKSLNRPTGIVRHAERVAWMCGIFSMPVPVWADPGAPTGPEVASLRNETVHEALFMGAPLGFALHGAGVDQNLTLEMQALICRLLVALLGGPDTDYICSSTATRQRQGLRLG
jgi:hypothetical protein